MDDFVWLDVPLHKNRFKDLEIDSLDTIKLSFDGAIMAVKKDLVETYYNSNNVQMIKAGYEKMPKGTKVESEEDLYKLLSYYISL
tara:strand:+ start:128 stop:382 length:255 start_codon:yes stop_codon:yes gene_type:complete